MDKARLEWVMSGLIQHALTKAEGQFVKTAQEDFDKNQSLTEHQEEKLESLYKEKSKLVLNKIQVSSTGSVPKKTKPRKAQFKTVF
ncbi:MAG: hypothetical protein ACE144_13220 [Thermodesulfobacteriota bacterium]